MRTSIDRAGRLVVPKVLRAAIGLEAGGDVEVSIRDGRIEIEPASVPMRVVEADGLPTIHAEHDMAALTTEEVRETIERVRR
ncbi:MAG: AbrB/MazE/SpoVT family DNA-binding domain-containing protein [Gaiellaceae bacterium]